MNSKCSPPFSKISFEKDKSIILQNSSKNNNFIEFCIQNTVGLSNICYTFLKNIYFEHSILLKVILLDFYIVLWTRWDLAILMVSLENYYTLFSILLLDFLNLLNYKTLYYNKIFPDLFYDFFLLFHFASVYVVLLLYILFLAPLMSFQILSFYSLKTLAN